jgi:hypothetical protein
VQPVCVCVCWCWVWCGIVIGQEKGCLRRVSRQLGNYGKVARQCLNLCPCICVAIGMGLTQANADADT